MATKNHNERSKEFENNWNFSNINLNDGYIPFEYKNTSAAFTFDASKQSKLRNFLKQKEVPDNPFPWQIKDKKQLKQWDISVNVYCNENKNKETVKVPQKSAKHKFMLTSKDLSRMLHPAPKATLIMFRQQKEESLKPEIMQFKATQKLQSFNDSEPQATVETVKNETVVQNNPPLRFIPHQPQQQDQHGHQNHLQQNPQLRMFPEGFQGRPRIIGTPGPVFPGQICSEPNPRYPRMITEQPPVFPHHHQHLQYTNGQPSFFTPMNHGLPPPQFHSQGFINHINHPAQFAFPNQWSFPTNYSHNSGPFASGQQLAPRFTTSNHSFDRQINDYSTAVKQEAIAETKNTNPVKNISKPTTNKDPNAIDWNNQEVARLINEKANDTPGALSFGKIAEEVSRILNRRVPRSTVQTRVDAVKTGRTQKQQKQAKFDKRRDNKGMILIGQAMMKLEEAKKHIKICHVNVHPHSPNVTQDINKSSSASPSKPMSKFEESLREHEPLKWIVPDTQPLFHDQDYDDYFPETPPKSSPKGSPKKITARPPLNKNEPAVDLRTLGRNVREGFTNRLTRCLLLDDNSRTFQYNFQKHVEKTGTGYWSCSTCLSCGKHGQKSTLMMYADGNVAFGADDHHPGCTGLSREESLAKQAERRGRFLASQGAEGYEQTYKDCKKANVDIHLREYAKHRKQLSRWRKKCFVACSLGSIAENFTTLYSDDTAWLDYDDGNVAIFATDRSFVAMGHCRILAGDATFSTSPHGTSQVFVLHGFVENDSGGEWVPLLMAIMKCKDEHSYQIIVDQILKAWKRLNVTPKIERLHLDYEAAEDNAFKNLVGADKVFGCSFHYSQIIIRRLTTKLYQGYTMKKGKEHAPYYRGIRTWIRCILALPLLPHTDALYLWNTVLHKIPKCPEGVPAEIWPTSDLTDLRDYVTSNWIEREDNMWSFFGCGRTKNTNVCEAYHSVMTKRYKSKPTLGEFLAKQQLEFTMHDTRLKQLYLNVTVKTRDKKYEKLDKQLQSYEAEYSEAIAKALSPIAKIEIMYRFCRKASYLLHDVRNKSGNTKKSEKKKTMDAMRTEANNSLIWNKDLNFSSADITMDVIDQIELSIVAEDECDEDFELTEHNFAEDISSVILDQSFFDVQDESGFDQFVPPLNDEKESSVIDLEAGSPEGADDSLEYNPGQDRPEAIHLKRLANNEWVDDVIISEVLQDLIQRHPGLLMVDPMVWSPTFIISNWKNEKQRHRLPTIPYYPEQWTFAIIPINIDNNHWTIAFLCKETKEIHYYDTLHGVIPAHYLQKLLHIGQLLTGERCTFRHANYANYDRQQDGVNCGPLICLIAEHYFTDALFSFSKRFLRKWRLSIRDWLHQKYFATAPNYDFVNID